MKTRASGFRTGWWSGAGGLFAALLALLLTACGGGGGSGGGDSGAAPTLVAITFEPDSAAAGLVVDFSGTIDFTDPDGDLDGGTFNYTYEGVTYSIGVPAQAAGLTSGTVVFQLQAVLSTNTGTVAVPCWLVDRAGHSSNTLQVNLTQLWTRQFGTALEDLGAGIAVDNGDLVVAGSTWGNLDGETGLGVSDVFVTRYAQDSTRQWTRLIGSVSEDTAHAVAVDGAGTLYVSGDTLGTSFDGQVSDGSQDGFVSQFDAAGNRQWTRLVGVAGNADQARAVAAVAGAVYVAGQTSGDLDAEIHAGGAWDAFLVKFDSSGNRDWTRLLGTNGADTARGAATDTAGNVYVTGSTDGVLGVDPSPGDPFVNDDAFVARYDANGTLQWVTQLGTACAEWGNSVAVDAGGNSYVVGRIYQCAFTGNSAAGGYDAFLARIDASGNLQWVRQFGSADHDTANGVSTDSAGNAYVSGYIGSVYFTGDEEGASIFLAKYDSAGNPVWLVQEDAGATTGNFASAVATDGAGNLFVTGAVQGQLDGHVNPNPGEDDGFILKFDSAGVRR